MSGPATWSASRPGPSCATISAPGDPDAIAEGHRLFHEAAPILELHLATRDWLTGTTPSYADFRMATFLPWNVNMRLPLEDYPALAAWYARLERLPDWADPFKGLDAPELPPIPA